MGIYVNPKGMSKEEWLELHGTQVTDPSQYFRDFKEDHLPVVLVDNNFFTAAGIAYSEREFGEFTDFRDKRAKTIYSVPLDKLMEVTEGKLQEYLDIAKKRE